jgi:hypothetical protein
MVFFFVPGGILVREKPEFSDARSLLRSGPAGSLRTDIRAVAQYAAEAGEGKAATDAVEQCLRYGYSHCSSHCPVVLLILMVAYTALLPLCPG